ncbi:hypothetical protein BC938DRAFT_482987, partial [Jimgerdemannia flammicorona]
QRFCIQATRRNTRSCTSRAATLKRNLARSGLNHFEHCNSPFLRHMYGTDNAYFRSQQSLRHRLSDYYQSAADLIKRTSVTAILDLASAHNDELLATAWHIRGGPGHGPRDNVGSGVKKCQDLAGTTAE